MQKTNQRTTVVGVFQDRQHAQAAVAELRKLGFREDQIGVIAHDDKHHTATGTADTGTKMAEGAVTGMVAGAGTGALWALGIAAGLLPAIGPIVAGGLLASVLASAAGGAAVAGIVGALIGLGVPEEEATYYENEFKAGRTLVTVKADKRYDEAYGILRRHGAYDMHTQGSTAAVAPTHTAATAANVTSHATAQKQNVGMGSQVAAGGQTIQVKEEQLKVHKQPVQTGEVHIRKEVHTEHRTIDVPVQREEVVIERRPASGKAVSGDIRPGEEIRIPVKEEQVRVEKQAVVKEEIKVGKRQVQDTEHVGGTVRKEEVRIEETGKVDVHHKGDANPKNRRS